MSPVMNAIDGGSAGSRAGTAVASAAAGGAAAPGGRSAGTAVVLGRAAVPPQAATRTARAMPQGLRVMKRSVDEGPEVWAGGFRGRLEQEGEDVAGGLRRAGGGERAPGAREPG